jgi:lysophospholipase L1-like esterase
LPWLVIQKQNHENALKFIGKKYYSLGDSIVENGKTRTGYQHYIAERYSMKHSNYGVGGSTVVDTLSTYQKLDFTDVSLVTIGFGVNDARTSVPLGRIGSYMDTSHDTSTFYGAYRTLLDKIYTDNPECRVILLTPLQRLFVTNFGCDTENANGCKLIDFVDAIIEIGQMYATPVCDMYRNSGLNQKNLAYYTTEGVHPEDVGYLRMANVVLNTMEKF